MDKSEHNFAIFPGSFNPVHIGHLMIAEAACKQFNFSEIRFVLSPRPPHKHHHKHKQHHLITDNESLSLELRQKMLEVSLLDNDKFFPDSSELNREGLSYTIDTVKQIKSKTGLTDRLPVILGFDSFLSLAGWHQSLELKRECKFLVAPRHNQSTEEFSNFYDDLHWEGIDIELMNISATQIRQSHKHKKAYRYLLTEKAFQLLNQS